MEMAGKNMKVIFKRVGRICIVLFGIFILILLGMMLFGPENKEIPSVIGWGFLLISIATLICILIAVVLDLNEGYKREKYGVLKKYIRDFVILFVLLAVYQLLAVESDRTWMDTFGNAVAYTCVAQAGAYIFAKEQ